MARVPEYVVNVKLAEILSGSLGLDCRAERVEDGRRPDIKCYYRGLIAGIESSYNRGDAERDAEKRVREGLVDVAIALRLRTHYGDAPEHQLEEAVRGSRFDVKVFAALDSGGDLVSRLEKSTGRRAEPATGWFTNVNLPFIRAVIESAAAYLADEREVKERVREIKLKVSEFTRALASADLRGEIRGRVYGELYRLYGLSIAEADDPDVAFGHAALAILLSTVFYEHVRGRHPHLKPLSKLVGTRGPIEGLKEAIDELLKIDYEVPLKVTRNLLDLLPPTMAHRVKELVDYAAAIAQSPALLSKDFAGRVYHEITGDLALRKGFATYYTEVPAAHLLSTLAVYGLLGLNDRSVLGLERGEAEGLLERIRGVRVGDLACGSGTLLTAAYSSLMRAAAMLKFYHDLDADLEEIGRILIERGIYGVDALRYASQITAINLALIGPGSLSRVNVYTIYLGYMKDKGAWLGSLELLNDGKRVGGILAYLESGLRGVAEKTTIESVESGRVELPASFDLVIMNPPFTRATGRSEGFEGRRGLFGFIVDEAVRGRILDSYGRVRERVREDLKRIAAANAPILPPHAREIIRGAPGLKQYLDVGQAGEGLLFLYLAYKHVREGGVIAFVLPRNVLAGVSWLLARTLLASKFHVQYVVVSSDPEGYNFSENTSLSEALIVAKRRDEAGASEATVFIDLHGKPRGVLDAVLLASRISGEARGGGFHYIEDRGTAAHLRVVGRRELLDNIDNWNRFVALPDPELVDAALSLAEESTVNIGGRSVRVPVTLFNELIDTLGVDPHQFHDHFERVETPTRHPIIYGGREEVRASMAVKPNAYGRPRTARGEEIFEKTSGRILLPRSIRFDTAHAAVMLSSEPVLSNLFYAVKLRVPGHVREEAEKALVLWFNTTWGLLTIIVNREETEGAWGALKMAQWRLLPVLNVSALGAEALGRLAGVFDEYAWRRLERIPRQFGPGDPDPARLGIDLGFLKALDPHLSDAEAHRYLRGLYTRVHAALGRWTGSGNLRGRGARGFTRPPLGV